MDCVETYTTVVIEVNGQRTLSLTSSRFVQLNELFEKAYVRKYKALVINMFIEPKERSRVNHENTSSAL